MRQKSTATLPFPEDEDATSKAIDEQRYAAYPTQDWEAYNAAKKNEKRLFPLLLRELCYEIEQPKYVFGCPPLPLQEIIFCAVAKVYSLSPFRQFDYDIGELYEKGFINTQPSTSSVAGYLRNESLTSLLHQILVKSSLPTTEVEDCFAVDSTGLGIPKRVNHFNRHTNRTVKKRGYVKLHVMTGVRTNIITAAEVTAGAASDRNYLRPLARRTAEYFKISEVYADGGYMSGENNRAVALLGGKPYIAFAKHCALDADYKSPVWKDALYLWKTRHPNFMQRYNLRNNVEATFSSLKARFGGRLYNKSEQGQINEALCKVICHNICVLIQEMFEIGINPISWSNVKRTQRAEEGSLDRALTDEENDIVRHRIAASTMALSLPKVMPSSSQQKGRQPTSKQVLLFEA